MRKRGRYKVFKLTITTDRDTMTSKKQKETGESDRVTGEAKRWRSWKTGRGRVQESGSEDFN